MRNSWDVVIVGAGPAGMSAAIETSKHGLSTLVLDRQKELGGQIFRNVNRSPLSKQLGKDYAAGLPLVRRFQECGAQLEAEANVWDISPEQVFYSQNGCSQWVTGRQVLLASGAMERPVPLPGWTLPGVLGAGASDVLLKSASLLPEGPVVLCGNGPLLLQSAVHLQHYKVPVQAVIFTGKKSSALLAMRHVVGALARPGYFLHGMGMALQTLLKHKCVFGAHDIRIEQDSKEGLKITYSGGGKKHLSAATVLLHEGVISESRITRLARCRHQWNQQQRYWHVSADMWGLTSIPGIRTAGDVASVRGAAAAQAEGHLVGLDICRELGCLTTKQRDAKAARHQRVIRRCRALQPFLDQLFSPSPSMLQPADDALVCRCEELTAGALRRVIQQGCYSPDGLKAQARPGMGTCQGRMCGSAVVEMIAQTQGLPLEKLPLYTAQPPLFPLRIGELVAMRSPADAL